MWSDDFWKVIGGHKETDLIDLSLNKSIPVGMWIGDGDTTCPNHYNEDNKVALGDMVKYWKIYEGETHGSIGTLNYDEFYNTVLTFFTTDFGTHDTAEAFLQ